MSKLRVGIILSDANVPAWIARILEHIRDSSYAEVVISAFAGTQEGENELSSGLYEKQLQLDKRIFRPRPNAWELRNVRQVIQNTQTVGETLEERVAQFKSMRLDVILNLGLIELPESILELARYGIWSLRCNGERVTPGAHLGWQEVLQAKPLIQCVIEAQRGTSIQAVQRSILAANHSSITLNQASALWRLAALAPRALKRLYEQGESVFFSHAESLEPAGKAIAPSTSQIIRLAARQVFRIFENKLWRRWFPYRWALMAGIRPEEGKLGWDRLRLKFAPRGVYWADPFLFERQGKSCVFFEEFVYKSHHGHIAFAEIQKDASIGEAQVALERPYHLSYPFIFDFRGEFYMIPETGQNRSIEAYRCTRFPDRWAYHKTLMKNVRAADTTLIEHSGMWWLFANIAGEGGYTWDELHLFYSDDPLSEHWMPHPMNPVVSDVRSARPAGRIFRRDGLLLRPSQDSSIRYGYALNLNRITRLTKTEYEEELVERLEPPKDGNILAVHTFNFLGDLTVVDVMLKRS